MTIPSTPATTDVGALADEYERGLEKMTASGYEEYATAIKNHRIVISALRNSAPQETRGAEPVAAIDLRSALQLLDSLDRIAEDFRRVEPCRHNNDNVISELKIELVGLREVLAAHQQSPRLELEGVATLLETEAARYDGEAVVYSGNHVSNILATQATRIRSPIPSTSHSPSAEQQLAEAGKAAIAIRNELDRTRAERDSWEAQFHSAAAAASEYSEFWEKHQRDFDQFGNYLPYSQIDGDLRAAKTRIAALESRIRRAADSSTDPVVARDLREALTTVPSNHPRGGE